MSEYVRCLGSDRPPRQWSGRGPGECSYCHNWHGVWPTKGTVHPHKFRLPECVCHILDIRCPLHLDGQGAP